MKQADPLRIAVIGCGAVTEQMHLPALTLTEGYKITLLIDHDLSRANQLAKQFGVKRTSQQYQEALQHADAVLIATPPATHATIACEFLRAGKHVLVEKPMALTAAECDAMLQAAETGKAILAVGLMRRFMFSTRWMKQALDQQILGKISRFEIQEGGIFNWQAHSDYFLRKEAAGGGVLFDTGAHTLDLLLWWLGDVAEFNYYDDNYGGVEADCELHLIMQSGITGTVQLSRTRPLENIARFYCERGILEANLWDHWVKVWVKGVDLALQGHGYDPHYPQPAAQAFNLLFVYQLRDWLAAIRGEHPPSVSGTEARRSIALIEACYAQRQPLELLWMRF